MKIREATHDDVPTIVELGARFHGQTIYGIVAVYEPNTVAARVRELISGGGVVFVAEEDGAIIGMIGAMLTSAWFALACRVVVELFWYVDPKARKDGAGAALLDALEAWWPQRAHALLMLSSAQLNAEVMGRLYRRRGFVEWDRYFCKLRSEC